jgi:4'-phosphopantetheinyl transferase
MRVDDPARGPWGPLSFPLPSELPSPGDCHLWPAPAEETARYLGLLDEDERPRVERFRVAGARATFVASRAVQRLVLSYYLGIDPRAVRIARDCQHCGADHGRPYVPGADFDYSVSHTGGWLVIAVVSGGKVGVDIESITAAHSADDLARRVFSPAEQQKYLTLPRDDRPAAFIRTWTRKEATVKLTGHGIVASFSKLDVSGDQAEASAPPAGWPAGAIHLLDLPPADDYATALASTTPLSRVVRCGPAAALPDRAQPS